MSLTPQALKRRAKNFWRRNNVELYVPTLPGLEAITASELALIGENLQTDYGGVSLGGDLSTIYRANLSVRTGSRVLLRLSHFLAQSYPMLYDHARSVDWAAVLGNCPTVAIHVSTRESRLRHRSHVQKVIHDAICARLEPFSLAPKLSPDGNLKIHVRLFQDRCTLSLDTTGTHLHKRGYRTYTTSAPMRETTAAALLLSVDAPSYDVILDPFCGAGTLLIEAALLARKHPPGADRAFALEQSPLHAPGTFRHIRKQLLAGAARTTPQRLIGFDLVDEAIRTAQRNAANAHIEDLSFHTGDARLVDFRGVAQGSERRLIVANMPYGKRLGTPRSARYLLDAFCAVLSSSAVGWDYLIVTPRQLTVHHSALVETQTICFSNGGIDVIAHIGHVKA